jgi:hypothetical protein
MDNYERFVTSFLRLNGYFTVPNFIVHAADDPARVSAGHVGNYTEADTLAVRMPHSREVTGKLHIANYRPLVDAAAGKFDVVIAEAKSGNENKPNRIWRAMTEHPAIEYIVRFVGLHKESELSVIARTLAKQFRYEDNRCRFRYVVFSESPNHHYQNKGATYIAYADAIAFLVKVRGECWIDEKIGVASCHQPWDDMLTTVFRIANTMEWTPEERIRKVTEFLAT